MYANRFIFVCSKSNVPDCSQSMHVTASMHMTASMSAIMRITHTIAIVLRLILLLSIVFACFFFLLCSHIHTTGIAEHHDGSTTNRIKIIFNLHSMTLHVRFFVGRLSGTLLSSLIKMLCLQTNRYT